MTGIELTHEAMSSLRWVEKSEELEIISLELHAGDTRSDGLVKSWFLVGIGRHKKTNRKKEVTIAEVFVRGRK